MSNKDVIQFLKIKRDALIKDSLVNGTDNGDKIHSIDTVIKLLKS